MISFFKKSLIRQLILGVSFVQALLMIIFVGDFILEYKVYLERNFEKTSFEYTELLARGSTHSILSNNFKSLEGLIANNFTDNILSVEVFDKKGKILAHSNNKAIGDFISDPESLRQLELNRKTHVFSKNYDEEIFATPIMNGDQLLGWVRMKRSQDRLHATSNKLIRNGTFFTIMAIILGSFLSWLLIHGVTNGLSVITQTTTKFKDGNFKERVELNREDELQILAMNFNQMLDKIQEDNNQIRETKARLDLALDGSGLGTFVWDFTTNEVIYDERWAKIIGYNIDEIEMSLNSWESRVHPEDLPTCYKDINDYVEGRSKSYDNIHRFKHRDGRWLYISGKARFSKWDENGKPIRLTGTVLDISETYESFDQKISELKDMLNASPSCVKVVNKDGELLEMNDKGLSLIQADNLNQVKGVSVYDIVHEDDRESFIKFNKRVTSGEKASLIFKIKGLKGRELFMETYAAPIKLPNGDIAQIAVTNDITEKLLKEQELEKQKTLSLHQAKLASIGELAAGVGHEINNPLAIIKGYINTVLKGEEKLSEEVIEKLEKIDSATDRITRIVKGLRTLSRSDEFEDEEFFPVLCIDDSISLVRDIYKAEGIHLNTNVSDFSPHFAIDGNIGKFQQVIMNLLSNARDAVEECPTKDIFINLDYDGENLVVSIKDTGKGMSNEVRHKIFEPFFTTKEVNKGTGIGLALTFNFVKELKGSINVNTQQGIGTEFTLKFPVYEKEAICELPTEFTPRKDSDDNSLDSTVLLAEDEDGIRGLLKMLLEEIGLKVVTARDGKEAYDLFLESPNKFDIIISDMKMPRMTGPEFLISLRENPVLKKQPHFFFITGGVNSDFDDPDTDFHNLFDGYFYKPFEEEVIKETLISALKKKKTVKSA